jgi:lysozyme family protein
MMSTFKRAVEEVLLFEGGYSNDPDDPGGETKYGISARFNPEVESIPDLTIEDASDIYYRDYWIPSKTYLIDSEVVATKHFLFVVNVGIYQATLALQRALRAVHREVLRDGIMGSETASAVNEANPGQLLAAMRSEQANYYRRKIAEKPHKIKYENGWLKRAYA